MESRTTNIVIGSTILSLDGVPVSNLTPSKVKKMFRNRTKQLVPMMSPTDLEFHKFIAKKLETNAATIVTESLLESIIVGTSIYSIDGIETATLTPMEVSQRFASRIQALNPIFLCADSRASVAVILRIAHSQLSHKAATWS